MGGGGAILHTGPPTPTPCDVTRWRMDAQHGAHPDGVSSAKVDAKLHSSNAHLAVPAQLPVPGVATSPGLVSRRQEEERVQAVRTVVGHLLWQLPTHRPSAPRRLRIPFKLLLVLGPQNPYRRLLALACPHSAQPRHTSLTELVVSSRETARSLQWSPRAATAPQGGKALLRRLTATRSPHSLAAPRAGPRQRPYHRPRRHGGRSGPPGSRHPRL